MILKHTLMECKTWQQNMVALGSVVFVLSFTSIFLNFFLKQTFEKIKYIHEVQIIVRHLFRTIW